VQRILVRRVSDQLGKYGLHDGVIGREVHLRT
jgi:hypothetical protein